MRGERKKEETEKGERLKRMISKSKMNRAKTVMLRMVTKAWTMSQM